MTWIKKRNYYRFIWGLGLILLFVLIVVAANLGVAHISFGRTLAIIGSRIPLINHWVAPDQLDQTAVIIILKLRLPRILLAGLLGAGLAVAGVAYQGIFKNPMADPYVLGISSGAALGAAVALVLGLETSFCGFGLVSIAAFGGGLLTMLLVYNIARVGARTPAVTLLLAGVAVNFFLTAVMSLLMTFRREQIERIVMWTMGSVATANWREVGLILPVVVLAIGIVMIFARDLNVILTGDETAQSLGVAVEKVKKTLLAVGTLMVAVLVSVSGIVGFVGLIVPHLIRLLVGPDHRVVIPLAALVGALLLIGCDTLARIMVPPNEIPLGIITAILGVPFFLFIIVKSKKKVC
jgi:iron complex transport system permease protein